MLKYGDKEEWFEQLAAEGTEVPALDARPRVDGVEWLWEAWVDLNSCRAIGMDLGPVPWTAVDAYATRLGLDEDEYDILTACVRRLEGVQRKHADGRRQQQKKAGQHGDNKRPRNR